MVKIAISLLYLFVILIKRIALKINGKDNNNCVILYYHSVQDNEREKFARQMELLLKNTTPIKADQITDHNKSKYYSIVTFDDGFNSVLNNATPELIKRGIPFTIFLPFDYLGQKPTWHVSKKGLNDDEMVMTAVKLKMLPRNLAIIGSHTLTHPNLLISSEQKAKIEIVNSKKKIEMIINEEVLLFSFPYGGYNTNLINIALSAGYKRLFTTEPELSNCSDSSKKVFGRIVTSPKDWGIEFWLKIHGSYSWLPFAISIKRKLNNLIGTK